ncbi:TrkA C-terminal domain-containing protein [Romeria aff. gracilis LEGE 07310]|uniref:TrkA C-terminal domain-containing protein n=1 Tax=Vasconcelosia minhoensis LEGE 07310 TaxID=915328 RepID=A0A8J7A4M3_9CYAN|nr:TrkA C-terminal domain-containing protein [Romeria gracilis]MBE9076172.1 TrkA C-terminal domain-containing protein [Romeria aff. gracilis LEGE 07310]
MTALVSVFVAITVSLLVTRLAAEAIVLTGLSRQAAEFQARSAFTGAGFTTRESEQVTNHPARRQIVMLLMLFGNAGVISVISSLVLTFVSSADTRQAGWRFLILGVGLGLMWIISSNRLFNRYLTIFLRWGLRRWTKLDVRDYAKLLRLMKDYAVTELRVKSQDWLAGKRLDELQLRDEGIVILGIQRPDQTYIGAPHGETQIRAQDLLIVYGREDALSQLDSRRSGSVGDQDHRQAVAEQQQVENEENMRDKASQA